MSIVKLTNYVTRDFDETTPVETLKNVSPFKQTTEGGLICRYGLKSALSSLADLRMDAESMNKYFFEIRISVEIGELIVGRMKPEELPETGLLNLFYTSKSLKDMIEDILGYEVRRNKTGGIIFNPEEVQMIHDDPTFNHLDLIIFPYSGSASDTEKPAQMAALFRTDNVTDVEIANPNKGNPFRVTLPKLKESTAA